MRKTKKIQIYPASSGMVTTTIPGTQNLKSFLVVRNAILRNNGSKLKAPGLRRIEYSDSAPSTIQAMINFTGTFGAAQYNEIVIARDGKILVLRDGELIDLGVEYPSTDSVTFERFVNLLIIMFENRAPITYLINTSTYSELGIPALHKTAPPKFGKSFQFRFFYGGMANDPHILISSEIDNPNGYTLVGGASRISVDDGDGDNVGLTGLAKFRKTLFAFKSQSLYSIPLTDFGFGVDQFSDQVGCGSHKTIVSTPNDVFWVSDRAIHSLVSTDKFGGTEEATVSYPIYEYFQNAVNWDAAHNMQACYDKESNCYLLAYPSSDSAVNNKILGFNIFNREFFEWDGLEFSALCPYIEGRSPKTLVAAGDKIGVLDSREYSYFSKDPIDMELVTGQIFPLGDPDALCNFTKLKLYLKPTTTDIYINVRYVVDSGDGVTDGEVTFNTRGEDVGAIYGEGLYGTDPYGLRKRDFKIVTEDLKGEGSSIKLFINQNPPDTDISQPCEIYGYSIEYDYLEDKAAPTII
jgi:hypothetical protein